MRGSDDQVKKDEKKLLFGSMKGKRPLRRPMRRWEDNIKMDLKQIV
jgi:hypothetical protein